MSLVLFQQLTRLTFNRSDSFVFENKNGNTQQQQLFVEIKLGYMVHIRMLNGTVVGGSTTQVIL